MSVGVPAGLPACICPCACVSVVCVSVLAGLFLCVSIHKSDWHLEWAGRERKAGRRGGGEEGREGEEQGWGRRK